MAKLRLVILGLAILLFCTSCVEKEQEPPIPGIDIPIQEMNTKIKIYQLTEDSTFYKNNDGLSFGIKNYSKNPILFENDFSVAIYTRENNKLVPVENDIRYPNNKWLLPTNRENPIGLIAVVQPNIPNLHVPADIRIVIIGHEKENPGAKPVGAFVDVTLNP
jgi:hypothetical protein